MTLYEEYAVVDAKIRELTEKKESLRTGILVQLEELDADKVETPIGKFTVTKLKTWTYPDAVLELGERFKASKAKAESTGEATYEETPSLRYTPTKL